VSYDFFVFPADLAEDLARATQVYESAAQHGLLTPGTPTARFVAELGSSSPAAGRLAGPPDGHDGGVTVRTTWADPMGNLREVAGVAAPLGLSVLDVQLDAVYDPRGRVEVSLDTEAGPRLPFLTRPVLREVLGHVTGLRYHWLRLSRGEGCVVQGHREPGGTWTVEHREADRRLAAHTDDAALAEDVLWSWALDDGRWRTLLAFVPLER
jgi:hypothetical protein